MPADFLDQILKELIAHYSQHFQTSPVYLKGRLRCLFIDGALLDIFYPPSGFYSFQFIQKNLMERVDTAPYHKGLSTYPNHHHPSQGHVQRDEITKFQGGPVENARAFLNYILNKYYSNKGTRGKTSNVSPRPKI